MKEECEINFRREFTDSNTLNELKRFLSEIANVLFDAWTQLLSHIWGWQPNRSPDTGEKILDCYNYNDSWNTSKCTQRCESSNASFFPCPCSSINKNNWMQFVSSWKKLSWMYEIFYTKTENFLSQKPCLCVLI